MLFIILCITHFIVSLKLTFNRSAANVKTFQNLKLLTKIAENDSVYHVEIVGSLFNSWNRFQHGGRGGGSCLHFLLLVIVNK